MSVKVAVRVRPFNQREKFLGCLNCIQMKDKTTILINPRDRSQKQHQFTFDYSFWSHDGFQQLENGYLYPIDDRFIDQKRIFKQLGEDILKNAWNGFNCCLFAYGQTGAGKSYSMIGYQTNRGIVPMACQKIFQGIQRTRIKGKKEFQLTISMLEIYNQKVQDLFVHTSKRPANGLKIRESKKVGVYVEGITRYEVHSYAEIQKRMEEGAKNRSLASTLMNQYSSRAHTIVMIEFIQKQFITQQKMNKKSSLLNLVDLAGSERIAKTGISDKDRLKQASQINKSLHTLGRVIEHLAQLSAGKNKNVQVPYRESALTRILETALGGNSVTTMICAVSPANDNYEQTLSTLRYADQTKKIKNKPIINESAVDKIIRQLRQENERLKQMLRIAKLKGLNLQEGQDGSIFANIQQIQRQIRKNMQSFAIMTEGMDEDTSETDVMITQFVDVPDPNDFYSGELDFDSINNTSTTTIGNARANAFITNLSQDRLLSFKIKYSCEQQLYVGNKNLKEGGKNKLILCGLGVQDRHARLFQINNKYYIQPLCQQSTQYTLVNGRAVQKKTQIFHNDRIIFGTNSVFLFKNFNQKGVKSGGKTNKKNSSTGIGTQAQSSSGKGDSNKKISNKNSSQIGIGIDIGTQDLNQSLLIDWQDEGPKKLSLAKKQSSKSQKEVSIQTDIAQDDNDSIDQKLLDYEFAINERQTKMFDTSSSGFSGYGGSSINQLNNGVNIEMANKLQQIEKQFEQLKKQNERKMKEKQQLFMAELKKLQIEKEVQKAKLREQLKVKQQQAKKISLQKQRIQKIRDKLIQIEKQRKQKQRKIKQSMLLVDDDHMHGNQQIQFHDVVAPQKTGNYSKKKGGTEMGGAEMGETQAQTKQEPIVQTKVQYVDRHHFHYDFNVIHNGGNQGISQEYKHADPSANTTSTTQAINSHSHDQSMLLDSQQLKKKDDQLELKKTKITNKNLTFQSVYNINQVPIIDANNHTEVKSHLKQQQKEEQRHPQRKRSLNLTDILYEMGPPRPRKQTKMSSRSSSQQNLLNMTNGQALASYIPSYQDSLISQKKEGYENVSLNFSDDMTANYQMRQEQLLQKIRQYQEKLKFLEQSANQKKQSIKNIRKSFAIDFGGNPNSENFFIDEDLFDGQLDLSQIQQRKNSEGLDPVESELQKKIKISMVQCQNQNIINDRALQVRKRKREAEELKEAFIKKQKKELQKKLVELIPMLQKFNLWARQMNRNLEGRVEIDYHNFTNYQIIDALKTSMKGKIRIQIKIINYEEGRIYKWPVQVFQNRFQIALNLFERFLQNPSSDMFSDKSKDPFWDPRDFQAYAVGYLSLQPLSYALQFEGEITMVHNKKIVGYLDVLLEPTIDKKSMKLRDKLHEMSYHNQDQIYDPRQLLQQDLYFTLSIEKFRPTQHLPTDKIEKYSISYEMLEDNYKSEQYKTQEININKTNIGYMLKHSLHNVTQHTLAYLADSPLCLTLNILFDYDSDLSNMSSSFIQHSQSSLNMSTMSEKILKSQAGNSSTESPPSFAKKKTAIIMENPDILTKIQKQYTTEQKRIRQRAQTIQSSNSNKKKEKGKQDCSVF